MATTTLYERLGGYDAIAAVVDDLLPRLVSDPQLGRFWKHRGEDSMRREKQLLIDFLCASPVAHSITSDATWRRPTEGSGSLTTIGSSSSTT
jgi:truncated hemoglobin YjbI